MRSASCERAACRGRSSARPGTDDPPGAHAITLTQDPHADGMLARSDLAAIVVAAVDVPLARGKTFAAFNQPGERSEDWEAAFAALVPNREAATR